MSKRASVNNSSLVTDSMKKKNKSVLFDKPDKYKGKIIYFSITTRTFETTTTHYIGKFDGIESAVVSPNKKAVDYIRVLDKEEIRNEDDIIQYMVQDQKKLSLYKKGDIDNEITVVDPQPGPSSHIFSFLHKGGRKNTQRRRKTRQKTSKNCREPTVPRRRTVGPHRAPLPATLIGGTRPPPFPLRSSQ